MRFAQTYILGRLRRQTFFSLVEANAAITAALERINARVMRRIGVSRRQLFEAVEMPVLAPLPDADYQFAEWLLARVSLDYHVEVDGFFYSVPHGLIREQVDVRATTRTIELYHRGLRVAAHQRRYGGRRHGTDPDHMPSAHRRYAEWTPDRFRRWGRSIGPNTEGLVLAVLANRPHPEQGFRTCLGVLRLFKDIDPERAELIAARAVAVSALTYKSIASIIANKLERGSRDTEDAIIEHPNLRGPRLLPLKGLSSMLTHPTLDLLHSLGLHGMAKGFKDLEAQSEARSLEHAEWLALLLEHEKTLRQQKRFESRARAAKLRHAACVEDVDYRAIRGLDRALFLKLAAGDWIRARHNLLVTGPCGVGKSWLACALGNKACRDDFSVAYHRVPRLFAALALGRADGRYTKMLRAIARLDLLILDDWGPEPLDADQRRDLLEIVEDRYESRSIIVTSQLPVDRWYEIIGNPTIADAILDRLVHNAYRIELKGESLRKQKQTAQDQPVS